MNMVLEWPLECLFCKLYFDLIFFYYFYYIFQHPNYNSQFLKGFDIAILFLDRAATPSFRVRPVPTIAQQTMYYRACDCYITGWGIQSLGT
jgi:hypothetical protein